MTVRLRLAGLPDLERRLGETPTRVTFEGSTLGDLGRWLQRAHAGPAGLRLADGDGRLDASVQVLRNGDWIAGDETGYRLAEGDEVTLLVLVAGG